MYEIIQIENDCEAVIDTKESQAEAQEYVTALNDTKKNETTQFFYKEFNTYLANESELF